MVDREKRVVDGEKCVVDRVERASGGRKCPADRETHAIDRGSVR